MGVGLIIAAVTIGATVATTLFAKGPRSTKGADMAPANLDAFRLTTAEEGTVIPRVFGTVRLPGNLLYYGNLSSEPEYEETTVGGKGGKKKKQKVLQGYHYRMDVWQGIGMGPLELVGVYQDDRLLTEQGGAISCAEQVWNNGTGAFYPAQAGPYASRLPECPYLAPAVLSGLQRIHDADAALRGAVLRGYPAGTRHPVQRRESGGDHPSAAP